MDESIALTERRNSLQVNSGMISSALIILERDMASRNQGRHTSGEGIVPSLIYKTRLKPFRNRDESQNILRGYSNRKL
jgi:hypothetical protein